MPDRDIVYNMLLMLNGDKANRFAYVCAGNVTYILVDGGVMPKEPLKGTLGNWTLVYIHDMYLVSQLLLIHMWIEHIYYELWTHICFTMLYFVTVLLFSPWVMCFIYL